MASYKNFSKKLFLISIFLLVFSFCSTTNSENSGYTYDECVTKTLSKGDYERWLNDEIDLSQFEELINKCLTGEIEFSEFVTATVNRNQLL